MRTGLLVYSIAVWLVVPPYGSLLWLAIGWIVTFSLMRWLAH